jgi:hypothetical protein
MLLTIAQASLVWCPMVRTARHEVVTTETPHGGGIVGIKDEHHVVGGCNSAGGMSRGAELRTPASCRCVAERCAMWRWESEGRRNTAVYDRRFWLPKRARTGANAAQPTAAIDRPYGLPDSGVEWVPQYTDDGLGAWVETDEAFGARTASAKAGRRGFCGLAGVPVHGS